METRMLLLIRYVYFFKFGWKELEKQLSMSRYLLIEELKNFFQMQGEPQEKAEQLLRQIEENEMRRINK